MLGARKAMDIEIAMVMVSLLIGIAVGTAATVVFGFITKRSGNGEINAHRERGTAMAQDHAHQWTFYMGHEPGVQLGPISTWAVCVICDTYMKLTNELLTRALRAIEEDGDTRLAQGASSISSSPEP